jgi:hypothetical protein
MHRLPVEPNRTGTAITAVAAFLDPEPTEFANEGSQALAWPLFAVWRGTKPLSITILPLVPVNSPSAQLHVVVLTQKVEGQPNSGCRLHPIFERITNVGPIRVFPLPNMKTRSYFERLSTSAGLLVL